MLLACFRWTGVKGTRFSMRGRWPPPLAMGPHPMGPHPTGPHPVGPHPMGPHLAPPGRAPWPHSPRHDCARARRAADRHSARVAPRATQLDRRSAGAVRYHVGPRCRRRLALPLHLDLGAAQRRRRPRPVVVAALRDDGDGLPDLRRPLALSVCRHLPAHLPHLQTRHACARAHRHHEPSPPGEPSEPPSPCAGRLLPPQSVAERCRPSTPRSVSRSSRFLRARPGGRRGDPLR
jgi:hypothetical protein